MSITTNKYIGPIVPLNTSKEYGDYELTSDYKVEVRQNLKNIVLTAKGERMMDKNFGLGIYNYLFENMDDISSFDIRSELVKQCNIYLPVVIIDDVAIDDSRRDSNTIIVSIRYEIPDLNVEDVLEMSLNYDR